MSKKQIQVVQMGPKVRGEISETAETMKTVFSDLDEVGNVVDRIEGNMDAMAKGNEQFKKEVRAWRREQEVFNGKINELISNEVAKQINPLVKQLNTLTRKNPRFVYVSTKFPLIERIKELFKKRGDKK